MDLTEIRRLASSYSFDQLEDLVTHMTENEGEALYTDPERAEMFNTLVKAEIVRKFVDEGMSLPEAIRELGRRMRSVVGD